ncbi:MAG: hypothetical protein RLZZ292_195 [Bacteroidota bacterium]|jgi:hypothetical protein
MKKQLLEEQFEEKFRTYRLQPNAKVWQTIETELLHSQAKSRKALPFWWAAAASGALLLSAYAGYQYYNNSNVADGQNVATIQSDKTGQAQNPNTPIGAENNTAIAPTKKAVPNIPQPQENTNVTRNTGNEKQEIKKNATEQPMQSVLPNNEVVIQKKEPLIDVKNTIPTVPKTVLAEVKTLPSPINTLPNNTDLSKPLPNATTPQPNTITYEPTVKQPIFSAWRELSENSPQDSTTSERLLQLAESKAKRLVKRVDIAGIWSDFKTLRGR